MMDSLEVVVEVDGLPIKLEVHDSVHRGDYEALMPTRYNNIKVLVIFHSSVSPDSYNSVTKRWKEDANHFAPGIPIVPIGAKIDLRNDPQTLEKLERKKQKLVTSEMGKVKAEEIGAVEFVEVSSLTGEGLREPRKPIE